MSDHESLREAIQRARIFLADLSGTRLMRNHKSGIADEGWSALRQIVAAAESTLPKTKMIETWHCAWACDSPGGVHLHALSFRSKQDADDHARFLAVGDFAYAPALGVKVTGPYMQEVPQ